MATLTLRKIIKLDKNALAISLPVDWVRYYNLQPGDTVEVIAGNNLTIKRIKEEG
ncbi:AbrB/MazE/SpoVT family DNA-binding domain-containing protein [Chloroflexota bacterium]